MSTVLIVDDSLTVRMDLEHAFRSGGFETHLCADLEGARTELSARSFGVVVLDVVLPDGDGLELLQEIKTAPRHKGTKVVLLSSESEVQDRVRGLRTGADEYVGKPYDASYLVATAREFLRERDPRAARRETPLVLIIDDSLTAREEMRSSLERARYDVVTATSGEEGLRIAAARRPDAMIVDGALPGIDGPAVIRQLRGDAALRSTPCLLLTGSGNVGELRAFDAGADAYVRKDEGREVLLARLQALLRFSGPPASLATTSVLAPKKMLAVDDSPTYLHELAERLREERYDVVFARSGEEALQVLEVERVDCILLDLLMPGLSGVDTCARIKRDPALRDIPLVILTSVEEHGAVVDGINAGADDFISKSSDFAVLRARLRAQLRRKQFEDENRYAERRLEAERKAREAEERYRRWLEAIPALAWRCDATGAVLECNQRWLEYTGMSADDVRGDGWLHALHPDDRDRAAQTLAEHVARGDMFECEYRVHRVVDGSYRWHLARAVAENGELEAASWMGIATDVEDQKRAEAVLRGSEQRYREVADALRDADRRKDEFLAMLSHELRNPLAPIRNSVYILEHADPGGEQAVRARRVIRRQTEHMTRLVEDLLDVTRIARGKIVLHRERVDLREVVRRTAEDLRSILEDRRISFRTVIPERKLWVDADATRLAQIIGNLLTNSAKFTGAGGEVVLALRDADGAAEIAVRDTGEGIEPALLPRLFEPFVQGERTLARAEGGLGLGLALVQGIAKLHGGTVGASSDGKGRGAEFTVRIPIAEPAPQREDDARAPVSGTSGRRVLVVDDNHDAADSLADVVAMLGHTAEIAYDAASALEKVRARAPDVVLCDIGMPDMSGYELARAIRAIAPDGIQLVAITGYSQPDDVNKAIEAGFDAHVAKPPEPAQIERLIAS